MFDSALNMMRILSLVGSCLLIGQTGKAAEAEIESALQVLLADVDLSSFLEAGRRDEMATGEYRIRAGDTLDGILNRAFPDSMIRRDFLRQAFVRTNPRAFRNGNPNWMLAGVTVRIPAAEDMLGVIFDDPADVNRGTAQRYWIRYP